MTEDQPKQSGLLPLALTAALAVGACLLVDGTRTSRPPQPGGADTFQGSPFGAGRAAPGNSPPPAPMRPSTPIRIAIPAIGVDAPLTPLGLDAAGHLQVPPDGNRNLAAWYRDGPTPGTAGNALIDGHVDNTTGPAVFYNLGALHRGASVEVHRADGSTAVFGIDAIEVYQKEAFPDVKVYGPTTDPQLRLITCGGGFDHGRGYLGNVVVYAHLTRSR